jgi:hypothetical protein
LLEERDLELEKHEQALICKPHTGIYKLKRRCDLNISLFLSRA